jgi:hypothetical protein
MIYANCVFGRADDGLFTNIFSPAKERRRRAHNRRRWGLMRDEDVVALKICTSKK